MTKISNRLKLKHAMMTIATMSEQFQPSKSASLTQRSSLNGSLQSLATGLSCWADAAQRSSPTHFTTCAHHSCTRLSHGHHCRHLQASHTNPPTQAQDWCTFIPLLLGY
jgi:hypothetical protein